ncbi:STAS domain-containing protein [Streptomyces sp. NPDC005574]|uniref:STAS domain-containing protein n=1 Tax=Streptomyces sp. NPDC005574 TaxID=3156891 RepID=UPI0033A30BA7
MTDYLPGECHLVIELHDVVDIDNDAAMEERLRRLVAESETHRVIIDIRTPVVTTACLEMLLRLRQAFLPLGVMITVATRHPLARRVFRIAGLGRTFHVMTTVPGARALTRTRRIAHQPARRPHPPLCAADATCG